MTNERAKADLAAILDGVQEQMRTIAGLQQRRAELTATATARGKKVKVTVNADNKVIDVKFSSDIDELTYSEIAKAVIEAAQRACVEVARETAGLMAPLENQRARLPKLSDLVEDLAGVEIPGSVEAPVTRPNSLDAQMISDGSAAPDNTAGDSRGRGGSVTDSSW
ncbi:YbaB/EbfC family nucleoid-associated protein [Nocardia speluncae]|uniref:YbaB/EbfC family nucleoid-associated protein n=1 Tax=Nocardia speluncae TaxID=419477 RepID=A0A846XPB9_9NOCA|nr:YbaB/EbfC family nucleoid-associated protein [Nocardia speluncae]NKY37145.1 YbaB/EbfC family nucleoid-associated protein [Nocardia speluncae]